jgi:energy-coupling factor transport system permease protein
MDAIRDSSNEGGTGRWHPGTALSLTLAASLVAFAPWSVLPAGPVVPAVLALLLGLLALSEGLGAYRRWIAVLLAGWLPLTLSMLLVHGLFFPEGTQVRWTMGPLRLTDEGLAYGLFLSARYALVFSGFGLAAALASVDGLARVLENLSGASRIAHPLRAALGLLPAARRRAGAIHEAQRARGLRVDTPLRRVRALAPLVVPLAAFLLAEADTRASTLATRGFGTPGRPTSLVSLPDSPAQARLRRLAPGMAAVFLVATHAWVWWRAAGGGGP